MRLPRSSGILLHPTSLPSRFGIGDFGEAAYRFIDFLAESGQRWWQVMPLGPTGFGDSPYQCFSAFAGNPMLLNMAWLATDNLLPPGALNRVPDFPKDHVEYGEVLKWKMGLLADVYSYFTKWASLEEKKQFEAFLQKNSAWLEDFALFMALKRHFKLAWNDWPLDIRQREEQAIKAWSETLAQEIWNERFLQYLFWKQWSTLKRYANGRGVGIIGDIPIFVAYDSADVWANPELFYLDQTGNPTVVAGVPPDYFSKTGQRWGNPLYRWDVISQSGFEWWLARLQTIFEMVDMVRLDHFRGFEAYWEIPADEPTAINGEWMKAPGEALFTTIGKELGELAIIAENLGLITPEVEALRKQFDFPGMAVLQFAFDHDPSNTHLPHNYEANTVVYTGTHDNDTTLGWWQTLNASEQEAIAHYLGHDLLSHEQVVKTFIAQALRSVAKVTIFPLQDILNLGSHARMNRPGAASGNWTWRFEADAADALRQETSQWLYKMTKLYGRLPKKTKLNERYS